LTSIVFVGGIHGVGKTTLCQMLASLLHASHVTAGSLIQETAGVDVATTVGKAVPDISANQQLLLKGLDSYRCRVAGPIVLDGHFSLLQPSGEVVEIPIAVYVAIAPRAVVLVETDSQTAHDRLARRDGTAPSLETVSLLARHERAGAEAACAALRVPMIVVRGEDITDSAAQLAASALRPLFTDAT
jgi:adenylate kinase